ncbi:nitrogenase stabilizing/protective protein NifW [soil metagenome]
MSVLEALQGLSSADEFFDYLGVSYDPQIVQVARLHIMRRMGQYLRGDDGAGAPDDDALFALCRDHLEQAYADFVASSPIAERVFKVHQEAIAAKAPPQRPFVPLSALTGE